MSEANKVVHIESCTDQEFTVLTERHAHYQTLQGVALSGGPDSQSAHAQLIASVPIGIVHHFRPNAKGGYNAYQVQKVVREKAVDGTERYFVHYIPLYEGASAVLYRRLLVGTVEGEESGWLLPVQKPGYQGQRFISRAS